MESLMRPLRISKENSTYQTLQALKSNRSKRRELGEVFIEGIAPMKRALLAGKTVRRLIYQEYESLSDWAKKLVQSSGGAQLIALDKALFDRLSDRSEPSELLMTIAHERTRLEQVRLPRDPYVIVLDRPGNLGNVGSIVRSANAFGVDLIVTAGHGVDPFDPIAIRASMGSVFSMDLCQAESTQTLVDWIGGMRKLCAELSVIGTDSDAETSLLDHPAISRPVILLLGNEAKGLSVSLKAFADKVVRIPMTRRVDSLNIACAASIMMFEVYRASGDRVADTCESVVETHEPYSNHPRGELRLRSPWRLPARLGSSQVANDHAPPRSRR